MENGADEVFVDIARAGDARLITLPDELQIWLHMNEDMVARVRSARAVTYDTMTEKELWYLVAGTFDDTWRAAHKELQAAEAETNELYSTTNTPLGAIGRALEGEKIMAASNRLDMAVAHFTHVNEGLQQREDLKCLLEVLIVQKRMLEQSEKRTKDLQMSEHALTAHDLGVVETRSTPLPVRNRLTLTNIKGIFGLHAKNSGKHETGAEDGIRKQTVPSLTKT